MSILIKGMEMPTRCGRCDMRIPVFDDGIFDHYECCITAAIIDNLGEKMEDCPLVPVPDHGRRVVYRGDVYNAIEEKRIKTLDRVLNDRYIDGMHDGLKQALFALATVEDAPTIIPAEQAEEGE